jgi:hypothetical protein
VMECRKIRPRRFSGCIAYEMESGPAALGVKSEFGAA